MITKIEGYQEMKQRHQKEVDSFNGLFFAFNNEQFKEGMEKLGLTMDDTKKIVSIGAGGYILREQLQSFKDMFSRIKEETKNRKKEEKFLLDALIYELNNHEYCITHDVTDALDALDIKKEDIEPEILRKAIETSLALCTC